MEQKPSPNNTARIKKQSEWTPLQLASFILGFQTAVLGACLLAHLIFTGTPLIVRFDPEFKINVSRQFLNALNCP